MAGVTRRIVEIRASGISDFIDCPARAEAKHLLGLRTPSTGKARLGTAVHASTAVYDESVLNGRGITADEAAAAAVDAIHKPDEEVVWDDDLSAADAEKIALGLHAKYVAQVAPTQDYVAVEVECERLLLEDLGLVLRGTTDRVRRKKQPDGTDAYGIVDLKTSKQIVAKDGKVKVHGHAFQMGMYELMAEQASGLNMDAPAEIIGMNTAKTSEAQRVGTGEILGARDVLVGTAEQPGVLEIVARMIHEGLFFGNPKSMMCHERYCPIFNRCNWRK